MIADHSSPSDRFGIEASRDYPDSADWALHGKRGSCSALEHVTR